MDPRHNSSLEERVARLEVFLSESAGPKTLAQPMAITSLALSVAALYPLFRGLGIPNHAYQIALAVVAVLLAYHRGWLSRVPGWLQAALAIVNTAQVAFLLKLFIGSGKRVPFFWFKYPTLAKAAGEGKWFQPFNWNLGWEPTALATWELDFTVIQTFLLVITLVGAMFRFQPFVSLTAFFLILVSVPAFASFSWEWVFPAMVISGLALYLQTPSPQTRAFPFWTRSQ